jgi:uncharacterized protein YcbK (DUF882 family)
MQSRSLAIALSGALLTHAAAARADITHVVQRGHTVEAIAHRYHVSVKAILEANHLKDTKHLQVGQTLIIPGVDGAKGHKGEDAKGERDRERGGHDKRDKPGEKSGGHGTHAGVHAAPTASLEEPPEPRGKRREGDGETLHAVRLGEEFRIRVRDGHGHIPGAALHAFERLMRQGNATHPPDPRLVALVAIVSDHFGGKPIEVVSGYRPYTPTQYTPHSNHNYGKALDFRVRGVKNESLRDFCRTLRAAGCGYYPNSAFVHLDVRDAKAYWVDSSRPGEPPKYDKAGVEADEGASDVPDEMGQASVEKDDAPGNEPPR